MGWQKDVLRIARLESEFLSVDGEPLEVGSHVPERRRPSTNSSRVNSLGDAHETIAFVLGCCLRADNDRITSDAISVPSEFPSATSSERTFLRLERMRLFAVPSGIDSISLISRAVRP